nr:vacuolar protein sorting-associated protein 24 homolog 1 [Tanacetum cinerariifolium]
MGTGATVGSLNRGRDDGTVTGLGTLHGGKGGRGTWACVIEEFMNDALDFALNSDGMKDEINKEVDKVLTAIAGDTVSQLIEAIKKEKLRQPTQTEGDTKPIYSICWDPSGEYLALVNDTYNQCWTSFMNFNLRWISSLHKQGMGYSDERQHMQSIRRYHAQHFQYGYLVMQVKDVEYFLDSPLTFTKKGRRLGCTREINEAFCSWSHDTLDKVVTTLDRDPFVVEP